jgi:hypothetical protein
LRRWIVWRRGLYNCRIQSARVHRYYRGLLQTSNGGFYFLRLRFLIDTIIYDRLFRVRLFYVHRWPDGLRTLVQMYFALAAIATALALVTDVIRARILGAIVANLARRFSADAACERQSRRLVYSCFRWVARGRDAGPEGCLLSVARQRCASLSMI